MILATAAHRRARAHKKHKVASKVKLLYNFFIRVKISNSEQKERKYIKNVSETDQISAKKRRYHTG